MKALNIIPTIFNSVDESGETTDTSYGFRIYDDYSLFYVNTYSSMEDVWKDINKDVMKLIHKCVGFEYTEFGSEEEECSALFIAHKRINLPVK